MIRIKCDMEGCKNESEGESLGSLPTGWGTINWTGMRQGDNPNKNLARKLLSGMKKNKIPGVDEYLGAMEDAFPDPTFMVPLTAHICKDCLDKLNIAHANSGFSL